MASGFSPQRKRDLKTAFYRCADGSFGGHVLSERDPLRRFWIDIFLDGRPVRTLRAEKHDAGLMAAGFGDGCYGFAFLLSQDELSAHGLIEVQLANDGAPVGQAIALTTQSETQLARGAVVTSRVRWLGGLRLDGELALSGGRVAVEQCVIQARVDGEVAAEIRPHGWAPAQGAGERKTIAAFDLYLPPRFADGRLHHVRITTQNGEELAGSPLIVAAYPDGLDALVSQGFVTAEEAPRVRVFDQQIPMSLPFASYREWRERFPPPQPARQEDARVLVLLIGGNKVDATLQSLERQTHENWIAASLPAGNSLVEFDPRHVLSLLQGDAAECATIIVALAGAVFYPEALARFVDAFVHTSEAIAAYADIELGAGEAEAWPLFLPAFDYERMLEQGYCAHLFGARRESMLAILPKNPSNIYRLFMAMLDDRSDRAAAVVHLPYPVARLSGQGLARSSDQLALATEQHLRATGVSADVAPVSSTLLPAVQVRRKVDGNGKVSIVIPTRNRAALLRACIESILAADTGPVEEIIVVDNASTDPDTLDYLERIDGSAARVLRLGGPFNYSHVNNRAIDIARGQNVCLLNNDIEVVTKDWLIEMMLRLADSEVGAVGALLIWPNGLVQHGGTVVGPQFAATHAFTMISADDPGYGDLLSVAHECSAVTAACLLTRKADYMAVGGLDETLFPVNFNDVDYCLKLRSQGRRIVFTPHVRLIHHESASRGTDATPERADRYRRELRHLRARWRDALLNDPYYSPALALDPMPFSGLAWPPRPCNPRRLAAQTPIEIPSGF